MAHAAFMNGTLTCSDLVQSYIQRITAYGSLINAISFINPNVEAEAAMMDQQLKAYMANGSSLPYLFCVPMILKVSMKCPSDGAGLCDCRVQLNSLMCFALPSSAKLLMHLQHYSCIRVEKAISAIR